MEQTSLCDKQLDVKYNVIEFTVALLAATLCTSRTGCGVVAIEVIL